MAKATDMNKIPMCSKISNGFPIVTITPTSHIVAHIATRRVAKPLIRSSPTIASLKPIIIPANVSRFMGKKFAIKEFFMISTNSVGAKNATSALAINIRPSP